MGPPSLQGAICKLLLRPVKKKTIVAYFKILFRNLASVVKRPGRLFLSLVDTQSRRPYMTLPSASNTKKNHPCIPTFKNLNLSS